MSQCIVKTRTYLLALGTFLVFLGSSLLAFTFFLPKTHLELVIVRTYQDGRVENMTYSPSPFNIHTLVKDNKEITWNDTLVLYIKWALQPSDWTPHTHIHSIAYLEAYNGSQTIVPKTIHWDDYVTDTIAVDGGKTLAFHKINITTTDLETLFGFENISKCLGTYTIKITYVVSYHARDPLGALHNQTLSLTYEYQFEVKKLYSIQGYVGFGEQILQESPSYNFQYSASTLRLAGLTLIATGVAIVLITLYTKFIYIAICRR